MPHRLFLSGDVDALGSDDEEVLASTQTCSDKRVGPDGAQEQPLSTPRVDVEFADLGEVDDHCDVDEEVTLEGGRFSKEERAGIDEIYQNILALAKGFGKKHRRSVQCVLTKLSMGFASRERRVVRSSWNAYVGLNRNPDPTVSQNDYIKFIAGPAYKKMIADAGGKDSDAWRRQHDDLIKQYDALTKERGEDIRVSLRDQKNAMRGVARRWTADMNTAKACGIHLGVVMVASEEGAEKENRFLVNSPFMQEYMTKCLGSEKILLSQIHQALCISEQRSEDVVVPQKRDIVRPRCIDLLKDMVRGAGIMVGARFQFKHILHSLLLAHGLQFINWPDQLEVESFTETPYIKISTTNWIQLYEACVAKEDGLKLVKVDTMGPHRDALILSRSGAVIFSKADVKGKGKGKDKGKSREVSWVRDETSSQADRGSPHAHPHSRRHSKHFKSAAIVGDGDDAIDDDVSSMLGATSATSTTAPYNPSVPEGLGALLVDALQQPRVSMADNEAGPSTGPYADSNPTSGFEMWSMTDAEFQSILNASAHGSVAPLDGPAFLNPFAFSDDSSPFLPFP